MVDNKKINGTGQTSSELKVYWMTYAVATLVTRGENRAANKKNAVFVNINTPMKRNMLPFAYNDECHKDLIISTPQR